MTLEWTIENDTLHTAAFSDPSEASMASVIDNTMEKAIALLHDNAKNESRYLLLEWSTSEKVLSVVVTDDAKAQDSDHVIKLSFTGNFDDADEFIADLKFYSKDFLTTCDDFMNYSLIAAFCIDGRDRAQLL
jgi:hypothetical protein